MARSDDYRAAYQQAQSMRDFVYNQERIVAGLDLEGGVVGGEIANQIRDWMERVLEAARIIIGQTEALSDILDARTTACEVYERAVEAWESATEDWWVRYHRHQGNPILHPPVGPPPERPTAPGPWAE